MQGVNKWNPRPVLHFCKDSPPIAVIVASTLAGVPISLCSVLDPGDLNPTLIDYRPGRVQLRKIQGTNEILRYFGQAAFNPNLGMRDSTESARMNCILKSILSYSSHRRFMEVLKFENGVLSRQPFLVGYSLSLADIALWSLLAGTGRKWESLMKFKKYQHLVRWYKSISVQSHPILDGFTGMFIRDKRRVANQQICEVDLPDFRFCDRIRIRIELQPSDYLHICQLKAALLSKYFAERYRGKIFVHICDTNPAIGSYNFVDNLLKDVKTLGITYEKVSSTSDYFPQLLEAAEELIKMGSAYVDCTPYEQMKEERRAGTESKCRSNSREENMKLWKEMIAGSEIGLRCCLRGKLNMQDPNRSFRDPVYYRCTLTPHPRSEIGSNYKVYPTYNFASPFVDGMEGITHTIRSSEYHEQNDQYHWIKGQFRSNLGTRVNMFVTSQLNMAKTLLRKNDLLWFVQNEKVDGWDDPRFPTVQGLVRRGLQVKALTKIIIEQAVSKKLNLTEWDKLWAINKQIIDPICPRHTAVLRDGRVLLTLTNGPEEPFVRIIPRHKKDISAGYKATTCAKRIWIDRADAQVISVDEEITLMDWKNVVVKEIMKDQDGLVKELIGVLHTEEDRWKATKLKLTWLPDHRELVTLTLVEFDYLITKKKLDKKEDFKHVLNHCTRKEKVAFGDSNMRNLKRGEILRLERKGYFRCDVPFIRPSRPIVLFAIPDGRGEVKPEDDQTNREKTSRRKEKRNLKKTRRINRKF